MHFLYTDLNIGDSRLVRERGVSYFYFFASLGLCPCLHVCLQPPHPGTCFLFLLFVRACICVHALFGMLTLYKSIYAHFTFIGTSQGGGSKVNFIYKVLLTNKGYLKVLYISTKDTSKMQIKGR